MATAQATASRPAWNPNRWRISSRQRDAASGRAGASGSGVTRLLPVDPDRENEWRRPEDRLRRPMYTQSALAERSNFDLRESLAVLRRRKWTIILVTVVVMILGAALSYRQDPVYQSTAT